jgi:Predicted ICC-like phosphoesterases
MAAITIATHNITFNQQELALTNQRAIFWQATKSLILSDLHIGKTAHFQKSGIPIPKGVLTADLERLKELIIFFKATNLIIVGDLFSCRVQ